MGQKGSGQVDGSEEVRLESLEQSGRAEWE